MSQGSDNLTVQPVENKDETVSEDEKVKNYLNNLKAKLSEQVDPPKVESEDDKVKN